MITPRAMPALVPPPARPWQATQQPSERTLPTPWDGNELQPELQPVPTVSGARSVAGSSCRRWVMSRATQVSGISLGPWHAAWPGRSPGLRPWELMPVSYVPLDPAGSRACPAVGDAYCNWLGGCRVAIAGFSRSNLRLSHTRCRSRHSLRSNERYMGQQP